MTQEEMDAIRTLIRDMLTDRRDVVTADMMDEESCRDTVMVEMNDGTMFALVVQPA